MPWHASVVENGLTYLLQWRAAMASWGLAHVVFLVLLWTWGVDAMGLISGWATAGALMLAPMLITFAWITNDAVIAMSVASHGFTIQTKNPGDFHLIAEFRPFQWETV